MYTLSNNWHGSITIFKKSVNDYHIRKPIVKCIFKNVIFYILTSRAWDWGAGTSVQLTSFPNFEVDYKVVDQIAT